MIGLELRKGKRAGIFGTLPIAGGLGAAYAFASFFIRRDTLLELPLPPMVVLLTQLYGVMMLLDLFAVVTAASLSYFIEFKGNALKKMYLLPIRPSGIFLGKFVILTGLLLVCMTLEYGALGVIGRGYLPFGTFEMGTLLSYGGYCFVTTLPVLSFMLLAASRLTSIYLPLGIGVAGFFSGMAMSLSDIRAFLWNPFVVMMKPAMETSVEIDGGLMMCALVETAAFLGLGCFLGRRTSCE